MQSARICKQFYKKNFDQSAKKNCIMIIYVYFNEHNKELPFYTIHFKCI